MDSIILNEQTLLSVVVPLFNEEGNLEPLFARLKEIEHLLAPTRFEFVFVDDGSRDRTFALASEICQKHDNVTVLKFARNYGSHAAIAAGLAASNGDCALFIAGDLQDPPALIEKMLDSWKRGAKIVWAARTIVEKQPFKDRFFSLCYWSLFNLAVEHPVPSGGIDFFLIDRTVVNILRPQAQLNMPIFAQVTETGFAPEVIMYTKAARAAGKSGWTLKKKFGLIFQTLLFSAKPLKLLCLSAIALVIFSLILSVVVVAQFPLAPSILATLIGSLLLSHLCMIALFSSIMMLSLHLELRLRGIERTPRFVVEASVSSRKEEVVGT